MILRQPPDKDALKRYDQIVMWASQNGVKILGLLEKIPKWASRGADKKYFDAFPPRDEHWGDYGD